LKFPSRTHAIVPSANRWKSGEVLFRALSLFLRVRGKIDVRDMRGSVFTADDIRRIIKAVAIYCSELGPAGELPPALYRDLIIYALSVLKVQSVGPDNDRRWQIAPDWKRRLELIGINPVTFEIEDTEEFDATVAILSFHRKQREAKKDQKRKLRGLTKGYYEKGGRGSVAYIPEPPPSEPTNGQPLPDEGPTAPWNYSNGYTR
jgi:hypothetical protein